MKLKNALSLIYCLENVELIDNDFRFLGVCFENSQERRKDIVKKYGDKEVKCIFSALQEVGSTKTKIVVAIDYDMWDYLTDNSFRYKGNIYRFYHLKNDDRLVIFKDNGEEVDTFIDWFYTSGEEYEELVENCIGYIKRKGEN